MKTFKLLAILMLLPAFAFAQQDTSKSGRSRKLTRPEECRVLSLGVDSLSRKLSIINPHPFTEWWVLDQQYQPNPTELQARPRSNGTLLIAEIPPGNPDNMPIWKPDNSVHYHLKIAGQPDNNGISRIDGLRSPGPGIVAPPVPKPLEKKRK
jgi:hypothetical protein